MTKKTLIYCWDEQAGRMRLHGGGSQLSDRDRAALESGLGRQYESLLKQLDRGASGAVVAFDGRVTHARRVTGFRVRYRGGRRGRCPDLILEPIWRRKTRTRRAQAPDAAAASGTRRSANTAGPAAPPPASVAASGELAVRGTSPWVLGFLEDVRGRFSEKPRSPLTLDDCAAMRFILAGLQDLCCDKPQDLAVLLLAGYVALGERLTEYADPEEAGLYRSAARVLDRLCGWRIARPADAVPASPPEPPNDTVSRWPTCWPRWVSSGWCWSIPTCWKNTTWTPCWP